jgi:hypothetical protein
MAFADDISDTLLDYVTSSDVGTNPNDIERAAKINEEGGVPVVNSLKDKAISTNTISIIEDLAEDAHNLFKTNGCRQCINRWSTPKPYTSKGCRGG